MAPSAAEEVLAPEDNRLFSEVVFHVVKSPNLSDAIAREITELLLDNGAKEATPKPTTTHSRITIDLQEVTHIIAADIDFPGYLEAEDLMIPVVTPEWVKVSTTKKRMAQLRPYTPDPRFFFSGVTATVAELPPGDKEAICGGIIAMGGQFSNNLTKFTTHIVALNMDNEKCNQAREKKLKVKVVLPHWFDDCLKLGRRISEDPYILPNPEIENYNDDSAKQPGKGPDLPYIYAQKGLNDQDPPMPRQNVNIFEDRKVKLGADLNLGERLRLVISQIIEQVKGKVVDDVQDADVYIGHFRDSDDYVSACRRAIDVGNLTWLYWMFAHGRWASPLRRLLHYPISRQGLPGMKGQMITVSNYGGDARLYLENLIEATGAKFTKSMKVDNTHLITASAKSEKCNAAREWNIHMVNHLWLEESYAQWEVQSLANPKYSHFPPCTNLMEVVGQTPIDPKALEYFYCPKDEPTRPVETAPKRTAAVRTPTAARVAQRDTSDPPPSTGSSSRKAKQQAADRLHDHVMPDVALYEQEKKRKGGVMGQGRRRGSAASSSDERLTRGGRKRTASVETGDDDGARLVKKGKKRPKPSVYLAITAYKKWVDQFKTADTDRKLLEDLGIEIVNNPLLCTHLAAPNLVRTEKFCCALAKAPIIVSTKWIEACIHEERIVETDPYLLKDSEGEARLGINLAETLERAKRNEGTLLKGQTIYCTEGVRGGYETYRNIVEANGGECISFKMHKRPEGKESEKLVLLSDQCDKRMWSTFKKHALTAGKDPLIVNQDWLLEVALTQRLTWSKKHELPGS